jgi:hypothetical protein
LLRKFEAAYNNMNFLRVILARSVSEHGIYITIAVLGFISSIVTIFVNTNSSISVKWLLGAITISTMIIVFLLRVIVTVLERSQVWQTIRVVRYQPETGALLIRANFELPMYSLLSIFVEVDGFETFFAVAYVENTQAHNLASVIIIRQFFAPPANFDFVGKATCRTTLPYHRIYTEN